MRTAAGSASRGFPKVLRPFVVVVFGACSAVGPASEQPTDQRRDDDDHSSEDSADDSGQDTATTVATLSIQIGVDIDGMYAENAEPRGLAICGRVEAPASCIAYLDPGDWWITAYAGQMQTCSQTPVMTFVADEHYDLTFDELPGVLDENGACVVD